MKAASKKNKKVKPAKKKSQERVDRVANWATSSPIEWLVPFPVVLLTFLAFLPSLDNQFVGWDDTHTLTRNQDYRGLGWTQLRWMFTTFHMGHYQPLSWMTFGLDYLLWGMDPFGYHLTNLLLHTANAVLVYFVSLRLFSLALSISLSPLDVGLRIGAVFAALLFALHPLRVESVAWATERRDVLSSLFLLMTILCYLRFVKARESGSFPSRWWAATMILYILSLLSRAGGMTLPIILLVLDVYPLRRLGGGAGKWFGPAVHRIWLEKIPFFLLALATGVTALAAQYDVGAMKPVEEHGALARLIQALFGLAFYLWKTVVPVDLSPLYEIPARFNPWDWPFLLSSAVVLTISIGLFVQRRRWPAGLAVWVCYVVILAPVLGIAQSGPQMAADRYTYQSCLGWALLAGAGLVYLWNGWLKGHISQLTRVLGTGVALLLVIGLGVLSWEQTKVWRDTESLWKHVLAVTQKSRFRSGLAHHTYARVLIERGDLDGAINQFRQTLQLNPNYVKAHNDLGAVLEKQGKLLEAMQHYQEAARIRPDDVIYRNLGNVLFKQGKSNEAIQNFRQALEFDPRNSDIRLSLGNALAMQGHLEEAIAQYREALKFKPDFADAYNNLGRVMAAQGKLDQAVDLFRRAVQVQPESAEAHQSLAQALAEQGKRNEAMQHYQEALRILKSRGEAKARADAG